MGDLFFVLLVVGGLGTFFFFKWREGEASCPESSCCVPPVAEEAVTEEAVTEEAVTEEAVTEEAVTEDAVAEKGELDALSWRILQKVMEDPGLLQTKLYKKFPREKRKNLQAVLLQLDNEKVLRREKEGNSYRLFPV